MTGTADESSAVPVFISCYRRGETASACIFCKRGFSSSVHPSALPRLCRCTRTACRILCRSKSRCASAYYRSPSSTRSLIFDFAEPIIESIFCPAVSPCAFLYFMIITARITIAIKISIFCLLYNHNAGFTNVITIIGSAFSVGFLSE